MSAKVYLGIDLFVFSFYSEFLYLDFTLVAMKRSILYLVLVLILVNMGGCSYFDKKEDLPTGKVLRDLPVRSEVDAFDLSEDGGEISFEKSGTVASQVVSFVSPQAVGSVVKLNAVVGNKVRKGDLLAVLGDSAAIDIADLQRDTAGGALDISEQIADENSVLRANQGNAARLGVETAWTAYQHALKSKQESQDLFELQVDSANLNVDRANEAYDNANDAYDELQSEVSDLEDEIANLADDDPARVALDTQLEGMNAQLDQLEKAISAADDGVTMAENAVGMVEEGYDSQVNQLNSGIDMALSQYKGAVNQYNAAGIGSETQALSTDLQLLQAQSAYSMAQIGADNKTITAPISGVITEVLAKLSNLVAPGQVVFKIENPEEMSVKTAVSLAEVRFLQVDSEVQILAGDKVAKGRIVSISPVLNSMTHKVDVEIEVLDKGVFVSGELVKIKYQVSRGSAIFVPLVAVDVSAETQFVRVIDLNGKVEFRSVKMGQVFGDFVEILSGLRGNEVVISSPSSFLVEGERVDVRPKKVAR